MILKFGGRDGRLEVSEKIGIEKLQFTRAAVNPAQWVQSVPCTVKMYFNYPAKLKYDPGKFKFYLVVQFDELPQSLIFSTVLRKGVLMEVIGTRMSYVKSLVIIRFVEKNLIRKAQNITLQFVVYRYLTVYN